MRYFVLLLVVGLLGGCMESVREGARATKSSETKNVTVGIDPTELNAETLQGEPARKANLGGRPNLAVANPVTSSRKIIYTATLSLVVEDFAKVEPQISKLVEEFNGYLADVAVDRISGAQRSGRWTVRLPVDRFEAFLDALVKLGVPESRKQTAREVTAEYVDLQARITNAKRLEERILKLLEDRGGEIKQVIDVEHELSRVRGEIEQLEGQLRLLTNQTDLTKVTIAIREEHDYRPPETPSFTNRAADQWRNSWTGFERFGENAAIFSIASAPWLALAVLLAIPGWWLYRRKRA